MTSAIRKDISLSSLFQDIYSFEELEQVEEKRLLLSHIVPRGINLLVAKGGSGKTFLAYHYLVQFLSSGYSVVYFDFDNPVDLPKSRGLLSKVRELNRESDFAYLNYNSYQRWVDKVSTGGKRSLKRFLEWVLQKLCEDGGKEGKYVVFLDSLQNIIPNVSDDTQTHVFFKLLREYTQKLDVTFIVLHHPSKVVGWSKGSTNIENMSDVSYRLSPQREGGIIVSFTLVVGKARYLTPEQLTIRLRDDYGMEIVEYAIEDDLTRMILRALVSLLRRHGELKQSELYELMKEKKFSRRQIEPVLKEYTEKGLFILRRGDKNAHYYSVNEESEYIGLLFDVELSDRKKELLEYLRLKKIDEFPPIRIEKGKEKCVEYRTAVALRKDIYKLSDEEAKYILDKLKRYFEGEEWGEIPEEEGETPVRERDEKKEELDLKAELLERVVRLCEEGSLSREFPKELQMFGIKNLDELVKRVDYLPLGELERYVSKLEEYALNLGFQEEFEDIGDFGELEGISDFAGRSGK